MRNKVNDIPDGATHKDSFGDFYMLGENGSWMFYHIELDGMAGTTTVLFVVN